MIRYTVLWDEDVESQFINAWLAGDSHTRAILTDIANWVDKQLAHDPDAKGQPCPELSARTIDVPISNTSALISATYQVIPDDRLVRVIQFVFRSV